MSSKTAKHEFGITLDHDFDGLASVQAQLQELARRGDDTRPLMADIAESLLISTQARFENERDPEGKPWAPLSWWTLFQRGGGRRGWHKNNRSRAKKGTMEKIQSAKKLRASGRLFQSLTTQSSADSLSLGTNVLYARIHQLGGKAGRGRKVEIPARPFLGFSAADDAMIAAAVAEFFAARLPGSGAP